MVSIGNTQKLILTSIERQKEHKTTETKSKEFTQAQKILIGLGIALGTAALSYAFFYRNHSITSSNNTPLPIDPDGELGSELVPSGQSAGIQPPPGAMPDFQDIQTRLERSRHPTEINESLKSSFAEAKDTKQQLGEKLLILMQEYINNAGQAIRLEKLLGNEEAPVIQALCSDPTYAQDCATQQVAIIGANQIENQAQLVENQAQLKKTYSTLSSIIKLSDSILSTLNKIKTDSEKFMNKEFQIHYPGHGYYSSGEALFASYAHFTEILKNPNLSREEKAIAFSNVLEDQKANSPHYSTFISYINNQCTMKKSIDRGHGNVEVTITPCSSTKSIAIANDCDSLPNDLKKTCQDSLDLAQKFKKQVQTTLETLNELHRDYRLRRLFLTGKEKILGNTNALLAQQCFKGIASFATCYVPEGSAKEKAEAEKDIQADYKQMENTGLMCASALPIVQWLAGTQVKHNPYWDEGKKPRFQSQSPKQ